MTEKLKLCSEDILKIVKSTVEIFSSAKKTPVIRAGILICDDENFKGFRVNSFLTENNFPFFVRIFKTENGKSVPRGSMGNLKSYSKNAGDELIRNSIGACYKDVNFLPVEKCELPFLSYQVLVPYSLEKISLENLHFEIQSDENTGVLARKNYREGLSLHSIDLENKLSLEEKISIALQNGGIEKEENPELFAFKILEI